MRNILYIILFSLILFPGCDEEQVPVYDVSGKVINQFGLGIPNVKIFYSDNDFVFTDSVGNWIVNDLSGLNTIDPVDSNYTFQPAFYSVSQANNALNFTAAYSPDQNDVKILNWLSAQQLANGLLASTENGNLVSLYDQSLAALAFMINDDFPKAEMIFDFFNAQLGAEMLTGVGGFSQFRDENGSPYNHRWMGDNAWLLIALNNYKAMTGNNQYNLMATEITNWLISLQDTDGGLFAGYDAYDALLNYKVTEGNLDAFNAVQGYNSFHEQLLTFFENDRWDANDGNLMSWPTNPDYIFALDNFSWAYCAFEDYPVSTLFDANRFVNTQSATLNSALVEGYDIDEDKDAIFMEGSAQMALAFRLAGFENEANYYLQEMEKILVDSSVFPDAAGFPYASNDGTAYGDTPYWAGADTDIAISPGAWYLFAKYNFNPFEVELNKGVPESDRFWVD